MNASAFALTFAFSRRTVQRQKSKRASKLTHQDSDTIDATTRSKKKNESLTGGLEKWRGS